MIMNEKCREISGCGPWRRPTIRNPDYKGVWKAPLINNPAYIGKWEQKRIPNPDYFEDFHPYKFTPVAAVGFELWTLQNGIIFDNIYIGHDEKEAFDLVENFWRGKSNLEHEERVAEGSKKVSLLLP